LALVKDGRLRLTPRSMHLCIDMQLLFSDEGPWPTPWMPRVLPQVVRLAQRFPERTVFTRFIPPYGAEDMHGAWRSYYEAWPQATRQHLDPRLIELMPPLQGLAPPAVVIDKPVYSAFAGHRLRELLAERRADKLILTGAETDVCVLATALGAIDHGYPAVIVTDAVCSASDKGHDSLLALFAERFSQFIETADTETVLSLWPRA